MIETQQGLLQESDFQEDSLLFLGKLADDFTVCPATVPHASILGQVINIMLTYLYHS